MAATPITRPFLLSNFPSSLSFSRHLLFLVITSHSRFHSYSPPPRPPPPSLPWPKLIRPAFTKLPFTSSFCTTPKRNTKVNFSLSDSESDSEDSNHKPEPIDKKTKLPPPYDPFNKKPAIHEPEDPTNLQEIFHKIRSEGLFNNAVKMFDGLSKDGLTHEALQLFSQIKDKGSMPDVVAHTAVIETYANAGQAKEAHRVYLRMLASGVLPNAYTYGVLIKGLAHSEDGKLMREAKKYVVEMVGKGMRPNAGTIVALVEGMLKVGKEEEEEGREFMEELKGKGFVPDEKSVREVLREKRGPVVRSVMNIIFSSASK